MTLYVVQRGNQSSGFELTQTELTGWIRTKPQRCSEGALTSIELHHKAGKVSKKKFVAVISSLLGHTTSTLPGLTL